tara:strand:+ start:723 stop:869 length:147 start_codon:yes stop_codon:yes gene_type:complete
MKEWESLPHLPIIIDKFPTSMQMKCLIFYFIKEKLRGFYGGWEFGIGI